METLKDIAIVYYAIGIPTLLLLLRMIAWSSKDTERALEPELVAKLKETGGL